MGLSTRADEKPVLRVAMVGHVDHGKSTLIGRIRHELSSLPGTSAVDPSIAGNWAHVVDQLQEEREREMTIDTTQTFLETPVCRLVFIDVPGHQELIHNMLSGATRADASVLVLAADEGVRVQTRRHALLLSMLGIHTVLVAVNKMDLANREEPAFRALEGAILAELKPLGISASATIPVVARDGDNILTRSSAMPWYRGPALLDALGEVAPAFAPFDALRLPVQDVYRRDVATVVGKLLSGTVSEGDLVTACPSGASAMVAAIRRFPENHAPAEAGESVGLVLDGPLPERGEVLAPADDLPQMTRSLVGRVFWLAEEPLVVADELSLRCGTQSVAVCVEELSERLDTATLEPLPATGRLAGMELGTVRLSTERLLVTERFARLPGLGRFVLERAGRPAGFGIVP
jgi:bifunctional enzyme CysN/CysC